MNIDKFFKGKKVFLTGHTGFKGSWLSVMLMELGAGVTGYSLPICDDNVIFTLLGLEKRISRSVEGDIRDRENLIKEMKKCRPDIVFHLAAQPLVLSSYKEPAYTYETNVMGTVNLLEAVRETDSVKSALIVTTDKVYENGEICAGYKETDRLDGYDPYSNSKSCCELVTATYKRCFLQNVGVSTARAGNVIGGGDFAEDRILPDLIRAALGVTEEAVIRNPKSVRPYQHVLEPLFAYLTIAMCQYEDPKLSDCYNIGPDAKDCINTEQLAKKFSDLWSGGQLKILYPQKTEAEPESGLRTDIQADMQTNIKADMQTGAERQGKKENSKSRCHEAGVLMLDSSKIKEKFGYRQTVDIDKALELTVEWTEEYQKSKKMESGPKPESKLKSDPDPKLSRTKDGDVAENRMFNITVMQIREFLKGKGYD